MNVYIQMHVPCMQFCNGRQLFVCEIEIGFGSKQNILLDSDLSKI